VIPYTLIRKPRLKHLYLRVKEGELIVTANTKVSLDTIEQFIASKHTWIQKQQHAAKQKVFLTDPHATIYFLGESYPVKQIIDSDRNREEMTIEENYCCFYLKQPPTEEELKSLRDHYYQKLCPKIITPIVQKYADRMQLYPQKIGYRHNRSRWGSCSHHNHLSLNTRLIMLPLPVITYVVIHELAHIRHKNHSPDFWRLVEAFSPDYKALRRKLRGFVPAL